MDLPPENISSLTPRRDLLKMALATGAGLALGAVGSSQAAGGAASAAPTESAGSGLNSHRFKFKLNDLQPAIDNGGGSVAECDRRNFPIVQRGPASIFLLKLKPGGLREPHWHPNCWEMDYVVAGTVQMTIVPPDGPAETFTLEAGDTAFVPQGYAHSIVNIGDVDAVIPITFNSDLPTDLGLSTIYREFPDGQFAQTFGVPASEMAKIPQPKATLIVVTKE